MEGVNAIVWFLIIGAIFYFMMRRGGCCGGGHKDTEKGGQGKEAGREGGDEKKSCH